MPRRSALLLIAVALVAGPAPAQAPLDRFGDPLPEGAVLRLGTTRWRHPGTNRVAFTADGKLLLSASDSKSCIFDVATGRLRVEVPLGQHAAISPDGKLVVAFGREPTRNVDSTFVFNADTGTPRYELHEARGPFAFSPDGRWLVAQSDGDAVVLLNAATGREGWRTRELLRLPLFLGFTADGRRVIAHEPGQKHVWDVATGSRVVHFNPWPVSSSNAPDLLTVSPDGSRAADAVREALRDPDQRDVYRPLVRIWHASGAPAPREVSLTPGSRRGQWVTALAYSRDGNLLAWARDDRTIALADARTGRVQRTLSWNGHFAQGLAFSPDGTKIAAAVPENGIIRLWEIASGRSLNEADSHLGFVHGLAVPASGDSIVTAGGDHTLRIWDGRTGRLVRTLVAEDEPRQVAVSPDGKWIAATSLDESLRLWDARTGQPARRLDPDERYRQALIRFGPDGRLYAMLSREEHEVQVRSWVVPDGRAGSLPGLKLWAPPQFAGERDTRVPLYQSLPFWSDDGRWVLQLMAGVASRFRVVEPATGRETAALGEAPQVQPYDSAGRVIRNRVATVAFHADSGKVAILTESGAIQVWDVNERRLERSFQGPRGPRSLLAWSPDGNFLATAGNLPPSDTGRVRTARLQLWEVLTGQVAWERPGVAWVGELRFLPDGRRLLTSHHADRGASGLLPLPEATAVLVWSLTPSRMPELTLEEHWCYLGHEDARIAYESICALAADPGRSIPYLREQLKPLDPVTPKRMAQLLADLNAPGYAVREAATRQLRVWVLERVEAERAVREALEARPAAEAARRMRDVLRVRESTAKRSIAPRAERAIVALEWAGTSEARALLESLAAGASDARPTIAARAALERLKRRGK